MTDRIEILETTISLLETSKLGLEQQISLIEANIQDNRDYYLLTKNELMSQLQKLEDDDSFRREIVASMSEDSSIKTERGFVHASRIL